MKKINFWTVLSIVSMICFPVIVFVGVWTSYQPISVYFSVGILLALAGILVHISETSTQNYLDKANDMLIIIWMMFTIICFASFFLEITLSHVKSFNTMNNLSKYVICISGVIAIIFFFVWLRVRKAMLRAEYEKEQFEALENIGK